MRYKLGDRVKIRTDLTEGNYKGVWFNPRMSRYRGQRAIITYVKSDVYELSVSGSSWNWNDAMLERDTELTPILRPGHVVLVDGEETVITEIECDRVYFNNTSARSLSDVEYIDGVDYNAPIEEFEIGDIVRCRVKNTSMKYGGLTVRSGMAKLYDEIAVVTYKRGNGLFYASQVPLYGTDDGFENWTWNYVTCEKIKTPKISEGDYVRQLSFNNIVCRYQNGEFVGSHPQKKPVFEPAELIKIKLTRDIFGVGKTDSVIDAYRGTVTGEISIPSKTILFNTLYKGEYVEV